MTFLGQPAIEILLKMLDMDFNEELDFCGVISITLEEENLLMEEAITYDYQDLDSMMTFDDFGDDPIKSYSQEEKSTCGNCGDKIAINEWPDHLQTCCIPVEFPREISESVSESDELDHAIVKRQRRQASDGNLKTLLEKPIRCTMKGCTTTFRSFPLRKHHLKTVHTKAVPCKYGNCGAYVKPRNMKSHILNCHTAEMGTCAHCGTEMKKVTLARHLRHQCRENREAVYQCTDKRCVAEFPSQKQRDDHVLDQHRPPLSCPVLVCKLKMPASLVGCHMDTIHGLREFECHVCRKKLSCHEYAAHTEVCRSVDRRYYCTHQGCDAVFNDVHRKEQHIYRVHEERQRCPIKGCKSYMKWRSVQRHISDIHNKTTGTCASCNKSMTMYKIVKHVNKCTGGTVAIKCFVDACTETFATKGSRKIHMRTVHPDPMPCPYEGCRAVLKPLYFPIHIRDVHDRVKGTCDYCKKVVLKRYLSQHFKKCSKKID